MHTFILQDWTTVRGSNNTVIQSEADWIDLTPYQDVVIWIDVREVTGTVALQLQTSPTKDEVFFLAAPGGTGIYQLSPVTATTQAPQKVLMSAATVPLARYLRWQLSSASTPYDVTFRIMISANAPGL